MVDVLTLIPLGGAALGFILAGAILSSRRRRNERRAAYYILFNLFTGVWGLQVFLVMNWGVASDPALAPVGSLDFWLLVLESVAVAGTPTAWFLFAAENARIRSLTHGWGLAVILAYPVFTLVAGITNTWHHRFVVGVDEAGAVIGGPLLYLHYLGAWLLITGGLVLLVREAWMRRSREGRRDAVLIVVAATAPFVGGIAINAMTVAHIPRGIHMVPVLLPILSAALGHLVFRAGFADVFPVAASEAFETMRDAAFVVDSRGVILAMNEQATTGFRAARIRHRLAEAIPSLKHRLRENLLDTADTEFDLFADGRDWWCRTHRMPSGWYGVGGTLIMLTDVTEFQRNQRELASARVDLERRVRERTADLEFANARLEEATRAKDRFLANVSHELRTPLSSIMAFSDSLLAGTTDELTEAQRERVDVILSAAKHQCAIIEDLLDLSRIKLGRAEVVPRRFELTEFVGLVTHMTVPLAQEEGLDFETDLPDEDLVLDSDEDKLRQILLNLLTNAVKFTDSGTVSLAVERVGPHRVRFHVTDTGQGIAPEELPGIMDEFVQVERADGMSPAGTGLGLAISRRLATLLGGELSAESEVGVGSTFSLTIPISYASGMVGTPASE